VEEKRKPLSIDIRSYFVVGDSSGADTQIFSDWKRKILPNILENFNEKEIFNLDETGFSFFVF
jgi:hypothetical protein